MIYHNPRNVVFVAGRSVPVAFELADAGDGWRSYRCRGCGWSGQTAGGRDPDAHVCPQDGQAQTNAWMRCQCSVVMLVTGLRRFYLDGDNSSCPVHGSHEPWADLGDLRVEKRRPTKAEKAATR